MKMRRCHGVKRRRARGDAADGTGGVASLGGERGATRGCRVGTRTVGTRTVTARASPDGGALGSATPDVTAASAAAAATVSGSMHAACMNVIAELRSRCLDLLVGGDEAFVSARDAIAAHLGGVVAACARAASAVSAFFLSSSSSSSSPARLAFFFVAGGIAAFLATWLFLRRRRAVRSERDAARAVGGSSDARRDAVLVLGATGRTGREVVRQLLAAGRQVVAGVRSSDKAAAVFTDAFVADAVAAGSVAFERASETPSRVSRGEMHQGDVDAGFAGVKRLVVQPGIDVSDPRTLTPSAFAGVSQVVTCVGSIFGPGPDGAMGYVDGMTSERVDAGGVPNVAAACAKWVGRGDTGVSRADSGGVLARDTLASFDSVAKMSTWTRDDDASIGSGSSASAWPPGVFSAGAWSLDAAAMSSEKNEKRRRRGRFGPAAPPLADAQPPTETTYMAWTGELAEGPEAVSCGCRWTPGGVRGDVDGNGTGDVVGGWAGVAKDVADDERGSLRKEPPRKVNLDGYDALELRVRGDGQRYKVRAWTRDPPRGDARSIAAASRAAQPAPGGVEYQATFDTVAGRWVDVVVRFDDFLPVRGRPCEVDADAPPFDAGDVRAIGVSISNVEFDGLPNLLRRPGPFHLDVASVAAAKLARPTLVMVSSAGVERNARAATPEQRAREIPIVRLNPGGTLNHKYRAEWAVRQSGLPYVIVRPTGLLPVQDEATRSSSGGGGASGTGEVRFPAAVSKSKLEVGQGDVITGRVRRDELAAVVVAALEEPAAVGATFELRRCEEAEAFAAPGASPEPPPPSSLPSRAETRAMLRSLKPDVARGRDGSARFPPVSAPAPSLGEVEKAEKAPADAEAQRASDRARGERARREGIGSVDPRAAAIKARAAKAAEVEGEEVENDADVNADVSLATSEAAPGGGP